MDHINLSRWADVILIAPNSKYDICLQVEIQMIWRLLLLWPLTKNFHCSCNECEMWEHQSTKENIIKLKAYEYRLIGPEIGDMACGNTVKEKCQNLK